MIPGISVAVSDTAVIGAYGDDDGGSSSGSAYVFTRSGGVEPASQTDRQTPRRVITGISVAVDGVRPSSARMGTPPAAATAVRPTSLPAAGAFGLSSRN
ncbi:MAG: hypothetical protein H6662_07750 [Ardenticatenaceae bacterium]|nr:hypothetical protein [Ardenticatenaceae bacterium]